MGTYQDRPGNGSAMGEQGGAGFGQRVDHLGSSAHELWAEARGAVVDLGSSIDLRGRVERHPYAMIAAAVGVGYLLGGGLFTRTTAQLFRLGIRLAALPLVKDELFGMAEAAMQG